MPDPVERLVNLALFLADVGAPVSGERIRTEVDGYPADQDKAAFDRMFERDKEALRDAGFTILADEDNRYRLDRSATFATPIMLSAAESAALHVIGAALVSDPSFPFAADLRLALAKLSAESCGSDPIASAALADEDPSRQAASVAALSSAAGRAKRVTFAYTNSRGSSATREIEPYGLFVHDGRWYLVGRDVGLDEVRTFAVYRMVDLTTSAERPKSPDFVRPADFDVSSYVYLPFQYGAEEFAATLRFSPAIAWRASALVRRAGTLAEQPDGSALWTVPARSAELLARFVIENGPGLSLVSPPEAVALLRDGLRSSEVLHG